MGPALTPRSRRSPSPSTPSRARPPPLSLLLCRTLATLEELGHNHWLWTSILGPSSSCRPSLPALSPPGWLFGLPAGPLLPSPMAQRHACGLASAAGATDSPAGRKSAYLGATGRTPRVTATCLLPSSGIGNLPHFRGTSSYTQAPRSLRHSDCFPGILRSLPRICFSCRKKKYDLT